MLKDVPILYNLNNYSLIIINDGNVASVTLWISYIKNCTFCVWSEFHKYNVSNKLFLYNNAQNMEQK